MNTPHGQQSLESAVIELKSMHEVSSSLRGHGYNRRHEEAKDAFAKFAAETVTKHDITMSDLSRRLGMTPSALGHYLQRRGVKAPGSVTHSKGYRAERCKRGHDLTLPGARTSSNGQCAECKRMLQRERAKARRDSRKPVVSLQLARLVAPLEISDLTTEELYVEVLRAISEGAHTPAKLAAAALDAASCRTNE